MNNFVSFVWQLAGVRENDVIIGIGDEDVKWSSHEQVVSLIKAAKNVLSLRLIQPIEKPVHSKVKTSARLICIRRLCHCQVHSCDHSSTDFEFLGKMR